MRQRLEISSGYLIRQGLCCISALHSKRSRKEESPWIMCYLRETQLMVYACPSWPCSVWCRICKSLQISFGLNMLSSSSAPLLLALDKRKTRVFWALECIKAWAQYQEHFKWKPSVPLIHASKKRKHGFNWGSPRKGFSPNSFYSPARPNFTHRGTLSWFCNYKEITQT